jgi:hypothetical protein
MKRWLYSVALRWMEGDIHYVVALVLGKGFESLLFFLFGFAVSYVAVPHMVRVVASVNPALAKVVSAIPPIVVWSVPWAVGMVAATVPWLLPFVFLWRRARLEQQKTEPPPN